MSFDLTLANYRVLCDAISQKQSDCRFITNLNSSVSNQLVILRHDVDRKPNRALRMAKLEFDAGIKSTYYFRSTNDVFKPEIMKEIERMGHEVGYHYEVLVKAKGDVDKAIELFEKELSSFREHVEVRSICSHGSPLSQYDSRDIWNNNSFSKFGVFGDASISISGFTYYSDTGGKWGSNANLRDNVRSGEVGFVVHTTREITKLLKNEINIYINSHPERWTNNVIESVVQSVKDSMINVVKLIIKLARNS